MYLRLAGYNFSDDVISAIIIIIIIIIIGDLAFRHVFLKELDFHFSHQRVHAVAYFVKALRCKPESRG
jgi:hypothetical protein